MHLKEIDSAEQAAEGKDSALGSTKVMRKLRPYHDTFLQFSHPQPCCAGPEKPMRTWEDIYESDQEQRGL